MGKPLAALALALLLAALGFIIWQRAAEAPKEAASSATDVSSPPSSTLPPNSPSVESAPPEASPPGEFDDKPELDITEWNLVLVNTENLLSADFVPTVTALENGQNFDSRAVDALKEFVAAARAEGLSVYITSSYRSYATQDYLFKNKVNQYVASEGSYDAAVAKARTIVAYPGSSEHQTGLAADIVDKYYEYMNESLADTALLKWMREHCAEYGFILRFPDGKQDITGIMFEPWHFRYVGKEAAAYIMAKGLCLEEFVRLYKGN